MAERHYRIIASKLMTQIAEGDFPVGTPLPGERQLTAVFGVSRPMIREAFVALEILGIIEARLGSGNFVIRVPDEKDMAFTIGRDIDP